MRRPRWLTTPAAAIVGRPIFFVPVAPTIGSRTALFAPFAGVASCP
jgi:hypothetical protein